LAGFILGLGGGTALALDKVVYSLNWTPQAQHIPFFAAKGKGFYEKEGIDVDIQKGAGSGKTIQRVATGDSEFGLASAVNLVQAIPKGIGNVRLIGAVFCNSPQLIVSLKKNNWTKPQDVVDKKVATTAFAALRHVLPILFLRNNVKGKAEFLLMDSGVIFQSVMAGTADFGDNYTPNMPSWSALAKKAGVELNVMNFAEFGLNHYDLSLICSTETMKNKPDLVKRFLKATYQGFRFTKENPDAAVDLFIKFNPVLNRETNKEGLNATFALLEDDYTKKHGLGMMDPQKIQATIDLVREGFKIEKTIKADDFYTNKYLK
jgi:NitT/TauT family transport system substrate-binding protein